MNQKKIIIADDDTSIHLALTYFLNEAGYKVLAVGDGQSAFDAILKERETAEPYDLLISDIEMPELSGLELIDKLNEEDIFLPVLVITGFGDKNTVAQLGQRGCNDYLDKPVKEKELINCIESIFSRRVKK